jgi:hypothetical protein
MPRLFPLVPHHIEDSKITRPAAIHKFRSGKQQRIALPGSALRAYELEWMGLSEEQAAILRAFFDDMDAQVQSFIFWHPDLDENIYVHFEDDTLTIKTTKTGLYYASCVVVEDDDTYSDPIVGKILVDDANVSGVFTPASLDLTFYSPYSGIVFFDGQNAVFGTNNSEDYVYLICDDPAWILFDNYRIYTFANHVGRICDKATSKVLYRPQLGSVVSIRYDYPVTYINGTPCTLVQS